MLGPGRADGVRFDDLLRRQHGQVGHVDQDVAQRRQRDADGDGQRQVAERVLNTTAFNTLHRCSSFIKARGKRRRRRRRRRRRLPSQWPHLELLGDEVEVVPAVVGPDAAVEGLGDVAEIGGRAGEAVLQVLRLAQRQVVDAAADDDGQRRQFGHREDVLHPRRQRHAPAVDETQHADAQRRRQPAVATTTTTESTFDAAPKPKMTTKKSPDEVLEVVVVAHSGGLQDGQRQVLGEAQRQDGQRRRLQEEDDDPGEQEGRQRSQEGVQRSEGLQKVSVLAARFRDQRPDLAVAHRTCSTVLFSVQGSSHHSAPAPPTEGVPRGGLPRRL